MSLEDVIKEIIAASSKKRIEGKKRLQKLVFLIQAIGVDTSAKFFLKDYGPFSRDVESATDFMSIFGDISEKSAPTGYMNYKTSIFELEAGHQVEPSDEFIGYLEFFEKYRSVELEVASTVKYYLDEGLDFDSAVEKTKILKPTKSNERTINASREIIGYIDNQHATATHTRSNS